MLKVNRIPTPSWAGKLKISINNNDAGEAFYVFAPHFYEILKSLHTNIEQFVNDPEQTFSDEEESFPTRSELSGEYYLESISYASTESKDKRSYFGMSIMIHCLGNGSRFKAEKDQDYLGLETFAYIWKDTGELEIEKGFNVSSI